jgi:hypothetical protein
MLPNYNYKLYNISIYYSVLFMNQIKEVYEFIKEVYDDITFLLNDFFYPSFKNHRTTNQTINH